MKYSHIFLDFDETLFNHQAYVGWADNVLADRFNMQPGSYKNTFQGFHQQLEDPHLRLFQHREHAKFATGRDWSVVSGELENARKPSNDYCYDEVHDFLEWVTSQDADVRILTFGDGDYQRYKIRTCSALSRLHIPVHVVHEPKREFLAREFKGIDRGVLIDDKSPLNLPNNWHELWIYRKEHLDQPRKLTEQRHQIHTLKQAPGVLMLAG